MRFLWPGGLQQDFAKSHPGKKKIITPRSPERSFRMWMPWSIWCWRVNWWRACVRARWWLPKMFPACQGFAYPWRKVALRGAGYGAKDSPLIGVEVLKAFFGVFLWGFQWSICSMLLGSNSSSPILMKTDEKEKQCEFQLRFFPPFPTQDCPFSKVAEAKDTSPTLEFGDSPRRNLQEEKLKTI